MEIGQVVDYCIEWNKIHDEGSNEDPGKRQKTKEKTKKRKATQQDWNAFFG